MTSSLFIRAGRRRHVKRFRPATLVRESSFLLLARRREFHVFWNFGVVFYAPARYDAAVQDCRGV
jgi:hypothetical protein